MTPISAQVSLTTPIERGVVTEQVYENPSFGIRWELPKDWTVTSDAPVASDHVLIRLLPSGAASAESVELTYRDDYQWDEKTTQQIQKRDGNRCPNPATSLSAVGLRGAMTTNPKRHQLSI